MANYPLAELLQVIVSKEREYPPAFIMPGRCATTLVHEERGTEGQKGGEGDGGAAEKFMNFARACPYSDASPLYNACSTKGSRIENATEI